MRVASYITSPQYKQPFASALSPNATAASELSSQVLRTNLFNAKDSIAPVKSYYYGYDGQINNEKSKKRENNIREEIERFDRRLLLMRLTQEFGGRALKIMNAINKNQGNITQEMKREFELYRVMSSKQEDSVLNSMMEEQD